ncbi:DDE superfamily endonuclease CENP-B [Fusarium pseudocircinatum]|uniref:DDE superfamily endonuclease CENP-B n=1 Tax=Fusarium pseudocircinatum TaxID=56676 RepID=A0A8H5KN85_9HYPO|nr:DDE superfamily endonuclease CENP-B [Fusarium pseudocircinatum]
MANLPLLKRGERRVGKCWTDRFIMQLPELYTRLSCPYGYQRAFQDDPDVLKRLLQLQRETGFTMGMLRAKMVVTRSDYIYKPKIVHPGNREWLTAICAAAAHGHTVPPFLCIAGRSHLAAWYSGGHVPSKWVIKTTPNGWTDHDTGLE